ncbi:hypothetical protein TPA0905_67970 [Streptomyces olivaceus]|nr:hypothetical protein TPA0905_67970 [Streptomyces olivaceus]
MRAEDMAGPNTLRVSRYSDMRAEWVLDAIWGLSLTARGGRPAISVSEAQRRRPPNREA